jgi:hypothetical protein
MTTTIFDIEKAINDSFKKSIIDLKKGLIELEEDLRACMYHHLRGFVDDSTDLTILLSHNVSDSPPAKKPDIVIFRQDEYLVGIELKLHPYNKLKGKTDIERLQEFGSFLKRGYFIHVDKKKKTFRKTKDSWKNNYYRELFYTKELDQITIIEHKQNQVFSSTV